MQTSAYKSRVRRNGSWTGDLWIELSGKMSVLAKLIAHLRRTTDDRIVLVSNFTQARTDTPWINFVDLFKSDTSMPHVGSKSGGKQSQVQLSAISYFTHSYHYVAQTLDLFTRLCRERGYPFTRLDGGTNMSNRQSLVQRFNDPGEVPEV